MSLMYAQKRSAKQTRFYSRGSQGRETRLGFIQWSALTIRGADIHINVGVSQTLKQSNLKEINNAEHNI